MSITCSWIEIHPLGLWVIYSIDVYIKWGVPQLVLLKLLKIFHLQTFIRKATVYKEEVWLEKGSTV